jgi:hypothetical protein
MTTNDSSRAWARVRDAIIELRRAQGLMQTWTAQDRTQVASALTLLEAIARRHRQLGERDSRDPSLPVTGGRNPS